MAKKSSRSGVAPAKLELCVGSYAAQQIGQTVVLTATGAHPTSGFQVFLEQSPIDVFPPEFGLWHKKPSGFVLQVITPFSVSAHFAASQSVPKIVVHDANGAQTITVRPASEGVHDHVLSTRPARPTRAAKKRGPQGKPKARLAASSALVDGCVQAWVHLYPILKSWCSADSIYPSDNLEGLWTKGPIGKDYDEFGINALIDAIRADSFFASCPQAKSLAIGYFRPGGEIQFVKDLINHLCPCGS
jgi:hypothetical protein